jgi:uncharacterized membrane protein YebE (DUF533 family)
MDSGKKAVCVNDSRPRYQLTSAVADIKVKNYRSLQGGTVMFNPEKLLGGLIRSTMRGSGAGNLFKGSAALGLLGVAMEAAEHYLGNQQQPKPPDGRMGGPPPAPPSPPKNPLPTPASDVSSGPPPPPPARSQGPPPDKLKPNTGTEKAVLLIRAMIAVANADGVIDPRERDRILKRLQTIDLSPEEQTFIAAEFQAPATLEDITSQVDNRQLALQVCAVSLLAIKVDTDAEHRYMRRLAQKLNLDTKTIQAIAKKIGVTLPPERPPIKGE